MQTAVHSDRGLGYGVAFGLLALVGALVMVFGPNQVTMAWGFAGAMTAAALAVVAVHVYGAASG